MNANELLNAAIREGLRQLYHIDDAEVGVQKTRKEFEGDCTFVTFPFAKQSKRNPEALGRELGEWLTANEKNIPRFNVVKGFLNLSLSDAWWMEFFAATEKMPHPGNGEAGKPRTIMLEYSSPNTNKPLHLGHVRNNLLGYSVAKILEANGHTVIRANLVNDRGIHICKSMLAWQKFGNGETPESTGMKGDHLVGKYYVAFDKAYKAQVDDLVSTGVARGEAEKTAPLMLEAQEMLLRWEQGDLAVRALWEKMNSWVYAGFDSTYKRLGVWFDKIYYESDTYVLGKEIVQAGLDKGVFYRKANGSVAIDLTADGLDEKIVLRSDGTSVYITQDLGTAIRRFEEYETLDQLIYTVGNEQDYHFKVLFLILDKLGYEWARGCYHLSYGMVELPEGKMKSREGTVVDADELLDEMRQTAEETTRALGKTEDFTEEELRQLYDVIGGGALKYFILKVDPKKKMMFDPKESIDFNGHTGPFIQYTHARIRSVLRKAGGSPPLALPSSILPVERELVKAIYDFRPAVKEAGDTYSPSVVANYAYELTKLYNKFYHDVPILKEPDAALRDFRIRLSALCARVIAHSMDLLGISVPERM